MPIYEYRCESCGEVSSILILRPQEKENVSCAACQGERMVRIMSRFSVHQTESQRLAEFDTRAPRGQTFYKDSRNVGLWAKKRAQELGAELGPEFDAVVERARTGKVLDD